MSKTVFVHNKSITFRDRETFFAWLESNKYSFLQEKNNNDDDQIDGVKYAIGFEELQHGKHYDAVSRPLTNVLIGIDSLSYNAIAALGENGYAFAKKDLYAGAVAIAFFIVFVIVLYFALKTASEVVIAKNQQKNTENRSKSSIAVT
jgi:hypothetical protein